MARPCDRNSGTFTPGTREAEASLIFIASSKGRERQTLYKLVSLNSKLQTPVKGMNDSMDRLNPSIPIVEAKGKTEKLTAEKTQDSLYLPQLRAKSPPTHLL